MRPSVFLVLAAVGASAADPTVDSLNQIRVSVATINQTITDWSNDKADISTVLSQCTSMLNMITAGFTTVIPQLFPPGPDVLKQRVDATKALSDTVHSTVNNGITTKGKFDALPSIAQQGVLTILKGGVAGWKLLGTATITLAQADQKPVLQPLVDQMSNDADRILAAFQKQ